MSKHYIKNIGQTSKVIGNLTILPNTYHEFYDDSINLVGDYFISIRNESYITGDLEYYINDDIQSITDLPYIIHSINTSGLTDGKNYRIYYLLNEDKRYLLKNPTVLPSSINYKIDIQKLHVQFTFNKGILVKAEYFENIAVVESLIGTYTYTYSNPVLKCEFEYHVDSNSYIRFRFTRRYWAYCDGTYSTEYKEGPKYYTTTDARNEAIRRRNNIINELLVNTVGFVMMTSACTSVAHAESVLKYFIGEIDTDIDKFEKGYIDPLLTKIETIDETMYLTIEDADIGPWLSNIVPNTGSPGITIRQYMLLELAYGLLIPNEIIS